MNFTTLGTGHKWNQIVSESLYLSGIFHLAQCFQVYVAACIQISLHLKDVYHFALCIYLSVPICRWTLALLSSVILMDIYKEEKGYFAYSSVSFCSWLYPLIWVCGSTKTYGGTFYIQSTGGCFHLLAFVIKVAMNTSIQNFMYLIFILFVNTSEWNFWIKW